MVKARETPLLKKTLTCTLSSNVADLRNKQYNVKGIDLISSFDYSYDVNVCFGEFSCTYEISIILLKIHICSEPTGKKSPPPKFDFTIPDKPVRPSTIEAIDINFKKIVTTGVTITTNSTITISQTTKIIKKSLKCSTVLGLNGIDSFVKVDPTGSTSCIHDIDSCNDIGVSLEFKVQIDELKDNMVIFSTGAEIKQYTGMTMFYAFNYYYIQVRSTTRTYKLQIEAKHIKVGVMIACAVSYSTRSGVSFYVDGSLMGRSFSFEQTKSVILKRSKSSIFFGRSTKTTRRWVNSKMQLCEMTVFKAVFDLVIISGNRIPQCSESVADVSFLIDASNARTEKEFETQLKFISTLIKKYIKHIFALSLKTSNFFFNSKGYPYPKKRLMFQSVITEPIQSSP